MKRTLLLLAALLLPILAFGQDAYMEAGGFPDDTTFTGLMHGVAVDADGKVWLSPFGESAWIDPATGDTVKDASGAVVTTVAIHVFNPDGSRAMDPIRTITVDGVEDTLSGSARGLRADQNGDILHVDNQGNMWRLNHLTGEGMNKVVAADGSLVQPAVADDGTIFTAMVVPVAPIKMWDSDFNFIGNAVDSARGFSRGFEVSGDGNTIVWGGFTNGMLHVYNRPDEFSPFGEPDTMYRGIWSESLTRDPDGVIWVSNDMRADSASFWGDPSTWLAWTVLDLEGDDPSGQPSFQFTLEVPSDPPTEFARGLAFAPDGMTAYAILWDVNTSGQVDPRQVAVKKFVKQDVTAIEREGTDIPTSFSLEQNYPNPFNPATKISFALTEPGVATLNVYDVYGRLVRTLVDEHLTAGNYSTTFDANGLASGNYYYHLSFNGERLSGTMTLLK